MKKFLAVFLTAMMLIGLVAAPILAEETKEPEATEVAEEREKGVLVLGTETLSGKFTPYYADTVYDRNVADLTQVSILSNDRASNYLLDAMEGKDVEYNGTTYHYETAANIDIEPNEEEDKTTYTITLRDDIVFSDGEPANADDLIFNYYVYSDPSYTGSSTFYSIPIIGMQEYRTQTSQALYEKYAQYWEDIYAAGADHEWSDADGWTQEVQDGLWNLVEDSWTATAQDIVDYVVASYAADYADAIGSTPEAIADNDGLKVALGMAMWGFADYGPVEGQEDGPEVLQVAVGDEVRTFDLQEEFPTVQDYVDAAKAMYEGDYAAFYETENAGGVKLSLADLKGTFISTYGPQDAEADEGGVPNIAGIKKLDDYTVEITTKGFDASAIGKLGIQISPLHYYGNVDLYDYENNQFGFPFGDLSSVIAKNDHPLGAGPYAFKEYKNRTVYFEANPYYFKGEPKIKFLQYKETNKADMIKGVASGTIDISEPDFTDQSIKEIQSENSNGELTGDTIALTAVDTLGYGYIGISAKNVCVGDDIGSEASKALRKGFATVIACMREVANDSYYGPRASVINYPISNTNWAAPQPADEGYQVAYSVDVDGNPIYTTDMTQEEKTAAAIEAAKGFFLAAGYTWDDAEGKFTAAPEGAKMSYECIIPGQGQGDHPAISLITNAQDALRTLGIELKINDPADANVLWDSINSASQELWTAAWGATIDPDLYQIYHSSNVVGLPGSTESNHYFIQDEELDKLIMDGRTSADQNYRKAIYKAAFDIILDWGVEIPNYQRQDCYIFSAERINLDTLPNDMTTFYNYLSEIDTLELND